MQTIVYPLPAKVIDQVILPGFANAGSDLLDPANALVRAEILGRRVASQMGLPTDAAQYLGPEVPGSCPYCHQLKIEFRRGNNVVCVEEGSEVSCITLKGK
ncbi:nadph-dependent fmn reductase [Penicillium macrosclerotiorum]|uniref:nadph-dependent fmn reductase n=1 Tax=Penicillium macrosclerotiorum TaxID=303699 RepID=UPI002547194C|nr:nadph-dependent fmn reductase [Penicillium macrosclerotiorum]KAJ5683452.1 nadph-dependent fmn reductase [Penicillium macrosclerotiorum]